MALLVVPLRDREPIRARCDDADQDNECACTVAARDDASVNEVQSPAVMQMKMMFIMDVAMLALDGLVEMFVLVPLGEV
jgi:hypothetical protein